MRIDYTQVDHWPPLAWIAKCSSETIQVLHGKRVETRSQWFCEAAWNGSFEEGGFDTTDIVFGSGGRLRDGAMVFVPSASTTDRLHSIRVEGEQFVSNSLPCLLSYADANVPPAYPDYYSDFGSIIQGLGQYVKTVETDHGPVTLTYYHNLGWTGTQLKEQKKPLSERNFSSFEAYRSFLSQATGNLVSNIESPDRGHPYGTMGMVSAGYDSPAVMSLAREHGVTEAITFTKARSGADDSGEKVGEVLGLNVHVRDREAWRDQSNPEPPFIAAEAKGPDVFFRGAKDLLKNKLLFTGFQGDGVWKDKSYEHGGGYFTRGDRSGLSLTEYRLHQNFIHVPVPFLGATQNDDILSLSLSDEMAPWSLQQAYDRPIPRRIVEEAGVPRSMFGQEKNAASVLLRKRSDALTEASQKDLKRWAMRRFPPNALLHKMQQSYESLMSISARGARSMANTISNEPPEKRGLAAKMAWTLAYKMNAWAPESIEDPFFRYAFPWAVEKVKEEYKL